jgi:hypothetical protein
VEVRMRLMAYQRYTYSGWVQDFTYDANDNRSYFDAGRVKIEFMSDPSAPRVVIYCKQPLRKGSLISNIRNYKNEPVMGETVYTITTIEPNITTFADFALDVVVDFIDDESAIDAACDEMFSMCGNPGQERLIGDYLQSFYEWAIEALEFEGADIDNESFANMVIFDFYEGRTDKWEATDQIWQAGYSAIAHQSGFHDGADEMGEGTGEEI